ncbi:hypothetical protein ACERK3_18930 [Phycisphaerales bacterium AB-hyl4]|uniref:RanBP2-type domain-containing protein n=1 Tax=Natronomicrosphaera hydrolytica TaxID=3242702 RepID=A0ABV4U9S3_9BACT
MFDPDALPVPDLGLRCRHCGYPLAGLRKHECPECGRGFSLMDYVPRGDCPPVIANGEEVRAEADVVELLRLYQVPYVELTELMPNMFGGALHYTRHRPPRIGVPREQYLEVVDLLRRWQLGELMPEPPAQSGRTAAWRCMHCQETNPPNFEVCWNCGQADEG